MPLTNFPSSSNSSNASNSLITQAIGSNIVAEKGKLYLASSVTIISIDLPLNPESGDSFGFVNRGSSPVYITQRQGEQITAGNSLTTVGITGRVSSFEYGDWVEFVYFGEIWWASIKSGYIELI